MATVSQVNAINKIEKFIFESAVWKLVLVIALLTIFKTGVWYMPNLNASRAIAQNPFTNPFTIGMFLGMQHFEQSFFAAAGLLFAIAISHKQNYALRYSWKFCLALLIGVGAGKFFLFGLFNYYSIHVNSGRIYWLREHIHLLLNQFFFHFHYIIWSVLGLGWLVALRFTDWGSKSVPFFITLAGLCLLLPISGDQTRTLAIITFPLVAAYWLLNQDFLEKLTRREISLLFIAWALMPWGWVWGGGPKWSAFPYDVAYILHRIFGWFNVPADSALWPFR